MTEKTKHQLSRLISKISEKFPNVEEPCLFTDIHLRVSSDTGDIMAFDDNDREITRIVVDEWINTPLDTEDFYDKAFKQIQQCIEDTKPQLGIITPYNYVLENEGGEHISEIYVVDDSETTILGAPFMQNLEQDLDDFINNLLKD